MVEFGARYECPREGCDWSYYTPLRGGPTYLRAVEEHKRTHEDRTCSCAAWQDAQPLMKAAGADGYNEGLADDMRHARAEAASPDRHWKCSGFKC